MRLAVVWVHYHASALAAASIAALRRDLGGSGLQAELLLIDNGNDGEGRALLDSLGVRRVDPGRNLGFAGGVNRGLAETSAAVVLVMNPDAVVLPGCAAALVDAIERGAAVAGPRFFWDEGQRFLLPPGDRQDHLSALLTRLAVRGGAWARWARRRWRRHARRHWQAERAIASSALSGALLAIRRQAWEAVGPFDEGYPLYFEETDWLLRLRRSGRRAIYEPRARAVHHFGASAAKEPRAREWFEASARRFRRRRLGPGFTALLESPRLGGVLAEDLPALSGIPRLDLGRFFAAAPAPLWIEVSPNAVGLPAAAERLGAEASSWSLPLELWRKLRPGDYRLAVIDARGHELTRFSLTDAGAASPTLHEAG